MVEFERAQHKCYEPNMIPLINVVFLLLIFFLVAGTVRETEVIPIDIPEADTSKPLAEDHVEILMGIGGSLWINNLPVSQDGLFLQLKEAFLRNPHVLVTVKVDATLPARRLTGLVNQIKQAGGRNLSIVTEMR